MEDGDDLMLDFSSGTLLPYDSDDGLCDDGDDNDCPILQLQDDNSHLKPNWYFRLLASCPSIIVITVLVVVVTCGVVCYFYHPPPDFSGDPTEGFETRGTRIVRNDKTLTSIYKSYIWKQRYRRDVVPEDTCYVDADQSVKFVFSADDADLFSATALRSLCRIEQNFAQKTSDASCGIQSLASRLAKSMNVSCSSLTDEQVNTIRARFRQCRSQLRHAPCATDALIRDMYYFADKHFYNGSSDTLRYTIIYVSNLNETELSYYKHHLHRLHDESVKLVAIDFVHQDSVINKLFNEYLLSDLKYFALSAGLVITVMMFYLQSVLLTFTSQLNIVFSFILAYFAYFYICRMPFFPFLNILAILVVIAINADDVFVYYDCWQHAGHSYQGAARVSESFSHAAVAVCVTSITTAAAFFANCVSNVTAIRCFGVFAGLAVLANLLLTVTWTAAMIVLCDKVTRCLPSCFGWVTRIRDILARFSKFVYGYWLFKVIRDLRYMLLGTLSIVGAAGFIIVFVKPKLQLPATASIQEFPLSNLLTRWNYDLRHQFKVEINDDEELGSSSATLYYVFGFIAADQGNWLQPNSGSDNVTVDYTFQLSNPNTQLWLKHFCTQLANQTFVLNSCSNRSAIAVPTGHGGHEALLLPFTSKLPYPYTFRGMHQYFIQLVHFTDLALSDASVAGVDNGFVAAASARYEFEFYDLQRAIVTGTYQSVALTMVIALGVMFAATLNPVLTLFALITISLAISVTVASIVLLGWTLNIIESIIITLAVGLSIDFTLHYGVAYRLSTCDVKDRVGDGIKRVGGAVCGAAFTTFMAGAGVIPCSILPYTKLGVFLMLVMTTSWLFATFLFQPLCLVLPPDRCQFHLPCKRRTTPRQLVAMPIADNVSLHSNNSHDSSAATF